MKTYAFIINYLADFYQLGEDDIAVIEKNQDTLYNLIEKKKFECCDIINDIMCKLMAYIFGIQKDYENMVKYYTMAINKGNSVAMHKLGRYYYEQKYYDDMKKYYLMAINKGNSAAMSDLRYYFFEDEDYENMKKYYLMAIRKVIQLQ